LGVILFGEAGAGALPNKAKVLKGRLYLFYRMLEQVYLTFFKIVASQ